MVGRPVGGLGVLTVEEAARPGQGGGAMAMVAVGAVVEMGRAMEL